MIRQRSIFALMAALLMTFFVSYSSLAAKAPTSYTPAQIEQIQRAVPTLTELRSRLDRLETLIQQRRWVDVRTYIHGPLGELRAQLRTVAVTLLPQDQKKALELSKSVFNDLVKIDLAAKTIDAVRVSSGYQQALQDFDAFLKLIPQA